MSCALLPETGGGQIDTLVLVDRTVDPLTPLCTQLTYEGLVDETLHIKNGVVQLGAEGVLVPHMFDDCVCMTDVPFSIVLDD